MLYDGSSYYERRTCLLAEFGHNRDGMQGKAIIVYGVMIDGEGRTVAVRVYFGDPRPVRDQVDTLKQRFEMTGSSKMPPVYVVM